MSKAFIILSGYNTRALTTFCRKLNEIHKPFYIIASGRTDFVFHTTYRKHVAAIRLQKNLVWEDLRRTFLQVKCIAAENEFLLCPSSEYLNHFALENREKLARFGISLPLVSKEIYHKVTDKYTFSKHCRKQGLSVPTYIKNACEKQIPFVAKPKINIRKDKTLYPYLILDKECYQEFLKKEQVENYYFEEYINGGESYYLLFYLSPFGKDIRFSQKNILQQAEGKSIVLAYPAEIHHEPVADLYVTTLRNMGFWGLIMIELKKQGQRYIMIEANPRLWGPSQLFMDNCQPLFDAFILEATTNEPYTEPYPRLNNQTMHRKSYLWIGGILQNIIKGHRLTWHGAKSSKILFFALPFDVYLRRDTWIYFFKELRMHLQQKPKKLCH